MRKDALHVGFDVDGVLRNLVKHTIESFAEDYPDYAPFLADPKKVDKWHANEWLSVKNPEVGQALFDYLLENEETGYQCFRNAAPYEEVFDFSRLFKILKHIGAEVSICTHQKHWWQKIATIEWIHEHKIPHDNIILVNKDKGHFGLDYLVDDHVLNIQRVNQTGGTGILYLQNWNKRRIHDVKFAVNTLKEYVDHIVEEEFEYA